MNRIGIENFLQTFLILSSTSSLGWVRMARYVLNRGIHLNKEVAVNFFQVLENKAELM